MNQQTLNVVLTLLSKTVKILMFMFTFIYAPIISIFCLNIILGLEIDITIKSWAAMTWIHFCVLYVKMLRLPEKVDIKSNKEINDKF